MDRDGGRTLKVSGLPTDVEEEKLTDKLFIHFLRRRNGGGEITDISVSKPHAGCALITFEDSEVARRVVQHGRHIFAVDERKYDIAVSLSREKVDQDEVFLCTQLTVVYSLLPAGRATLSAAQYRFPDVCFRFNTEEQLCTLEGRFSEVQALAAELLASFESKLPATRRLPGTGEEDLKPSATNQKSLSREADSRSSREWQEKARSSGKASTLRVDGSSETEKSRASGYDGWEAAVAPATLEDHSLALDSDIFRYLQQHCGEEYRRILGRHAVEVVDVAAQDVTTLYLKAGEGVVGGGVHIQQVHRELAQLYQETEAQLRKEQLSKDLVPRSGLTAAVSTLRQRLPRLMLSDDDRHIYLVGSSGDISEAKQFLLDMKGTEGLEHGGVSQLQHLRDELFSARAENRLPTAYGGTGMDAEWMNLRERVDKVGEDRPRPLLDDTCSQEDVQKRFAFPTIKQQKNCVNSPQRPGGSPAFGSGGLAVGRGQDIFKRTTSAESFPFRGLMPTSTVLPSKNKHFASTQSSPPGNTVVDRGSPRTATSSPRTGAQTTLRRSNSFSGHIRSRRCETEEEDLRNFPGMMKQTATDALSATFGKRDVYKVEMLVQTTTWIYIKDIYSEWLEDMKSSLDIKEILSENNISLQLTGSDPDKLSSFQKNVMKMESAVCIKEVPLKKLGIQDSKNEILEEFCEGLRRRFPKVKIKFRLKKIVILGPENLCDEVHLCLKEVLCSRTEKEKEAEEGLLEENHSCHAVLKKTQIQPLSQEPADSRKNAVATSRSYSSANGGLHSSKGFADGAKRDETERECKPASGSNEEENRGLTELGLASGEEDRGWSGLEKEATAKLKQEVGGRANMVLTRPRELGWTAATPTGPTSLPAFAFSSQNFGSNFKAKSLNKRSSGDPESRDAQVEEDAKAVETSGYGKTEKESKSAACGCGVSGPSVSRTACGVTLCPQCLYRIHSSCRVCHHKDHLQGIKGSISFSEMSSSLPGHLKEMTLKITYRIPSGIQGTQDPSPGASFQGARFEAFLPSNERTLKLLPLLEKAFARGHTFVIKGGEVAWGSIPHKTSTDGGIPRKGYPDSRFLDRLEQSLRSLGLEGDDAGKTEEKTQNQQL
ncbi:hypothetical protein GN956_G20389 [Arapaima gigas]